MAGLLLWRWSGAVGGTSSRSGTDERVSSSAPMAPSDLLAGPAGRRCGGMPPAVAAGWPAGPAAARPAAPQRASRPRRAGADQRGQLAQHGPGDLQVGVGLRVGRAAALVVEAGQVIAQRVLEDLVRADRQVGRVAGQVVGGQVALHGRSRRWPAWPTTGRRTAAPCWPCHRPYSSRCRPVKSWSADPAWQPVGQPVHRGAVVAEAVVGRADPLPGQLGGQPVRCGPRPGRRARRSAWILATAAARVAQLGGGVGLVGPVRARSARPR